MEALGTADPSGATWLFEHGPDYIVHPSETRALGILKAGDNFEFISWTGLVESGNTVSVDDGPLVPTYLLKNPRRGLFGSRVLAWEISADSNLSSRLELVGVPYAEEHPLSMALGVMTSKMADGARVSVGIVFGPWGC